MSPYRRSAVQTHRAETPDPVPCPPPPRFRGWVLGGGGDGPVGAEDLKAVWGQAPQINERGEVFRLQTISPVER